MTSKQRSFLIGKSAGLETLFAVGKAGITPEVIEAVSEALRARELVKIAISRNLGEDEDEAARMLAERTQSELVIRIGHKAVLYRPNPKKKNRIILPG